MGEQQRVEILKTLYRDARVLILDEPTAVLTPQEAEALFETLRAMAAEGRTVIFISHKLHEVTAVADRVTVLRGGRSVATVETAGVTNTSSPRSWSGATSRSARRRGWRVVGDPVLVVEAISARGDRGVDALRDVSFDVRARRGARGRGRRRERPAGARGGDHRASTADRRAR